jgi:hypothetical protein
MGRDGPRMRHLLRRLPLNNVLLQNRHIHHAWRRRWLRNVTRLNDMLRGWLSTDWNRGWLSWYRVYNLTSCAGRWLCDVDNLWLVTLAVGGERALAVIVHGDAVDDE